jgi:hypothetical protein
LIEWRKKTIGMNLTTNEIDNVGDINDMDTIGTKG